MTAMMGPPEKAFAPKTPLAIYSKMRTGLRHVGIINWITAAAASSVRLLVRDFLDGWMVGSWVHKIKSLDSSHWALD